MASCGHLIVNLCNHPFFCLASDVFSITLCIKLGLSHPLIVGMSHYICNQPLDLMRIHLFPCDHGGEKMTLHDIVQDVFVAIARDT